MTWRLERHTALSRFLIRMAIVLAVLSPCSKGQATEDDFLRLYNQLTTNYSRHMRPVVNQLDPVLIDFTFTLFSILEVKDTESHIDFIPLVEAKWHDHNLVWDPQNYGGLERISLTEAIIWAPQLSLYPSQGDEGLLWAQPTSHFVSSDGTVSFANAGSMSQFCDLDMTYFPYDYQKCILDIQVIDAYASEIDFRSTEATLGRSFIQNKEWLVTNLSSIVNTFGYPETFSTVKITLRLQRRPTFCSLNIIVPAIMVSVLCMLTFFVPIESGERLGYTLTTLLSLAVYITYIGALIPRASNPIPILFEYMVFLFSISTLGVVFTLIVIKLRWSPVETSADNRKYVYFLGCRVHLSRRRWLNRVDVIGWFRGDADDNRINKSVSMTSIQSSNGIDTSDKMANLSRGTDRTFESHTSMEKKINIQVQPAIKDPRNFHAEKLPFPVTEDQTSLSEENKDVDPSLVNLCNYLDMASFCVTFLAFGIMTAYTLTRFFLQEEPQ